MYTRYYDGYMQKPKENIDTTPNSCCEENTAIIPTQEKCEETSTVAAVGKGLPFNMKTDDLILIAVLILVATESSDDWLLPVILGYLLISNTL